MILRRIGQILLSAMLLIGFASTAYSATPAEYRDKIETARNLIAELLAEAADLATTETGGEIHKEHLTEIRGLLPVSSSVETYLGPTEISNKWLHSRLDELETQPELSKRAVILTEIEERLAAISWKITEAEIAVRTAHTKDEEKQKLAEILRREEFKQPSKNDRSLIQRGIDAFLQWLADLFTSASPRPLENKGVPGLADGLRIVLLILLVGLIGFGFYRFAPVLFPLFRGKAGGEKRDRIILGERISGEQSAGGLLAEAEQMADAGDLRGAIRKGYVALLCELNDRGIIGIARHKTNRDYLRDVRAKREIYDGVSGLTISFERHWYGLQPLDRGVWDEFRARYADIAKRDR